MSTVGNDRNWIFFAQMAQSWVSRRQTLQNCGSWALNNWLGFTQHSQVWPSFQNNIVAVCSHICHTMKLGLSRPLVFHRVFIELIESRRLSRQMSFYILWSPLLSPPSPTFCAKVAAFAVQYIRDVWLFPLYWLTFSWGAECMLSLTCSSLPLAVLFHFSYPHLVFPIWLDLDKGV